MATATGDAGAASWRASGRDSVRSEEKYLPLNAPVQASSIKDYSLQAFLGEGSTAHVYLATRVEDCEQVAVKVVDKLLAQQAQMEHKVQREILLHAPLRHRHVVRVRDAFEDARSHYLVLEYCAGGSVAALARVLREQKTPMDEATAKNIFLQTALGVAYLHERGIIHRDLKLSNLLLTNDGDVKISDFGLATLMSDEHITVCGTPNFIAPEVLVAGDSATYDQTVDIWSLGCILYSLLLGKPPFEGAKVSDTLANVTNAGLQPLRFPRGFPATVGDLIHRMLSRDAASRPKIAQVLAHPWLRPLTPTNRLAAYSGSIHQPRFSGHNPFARLTTNARSGGKAPAPRRRSVSKKRQSKPVTKRHTGYESDESSASGEKIQIECDLEDLDLSSSDESEATNSDFDDSHSEVYKDFSSDLSLDISATAMDPEAIDTSKAAETQQATEDDRDEAFEPLFNGLAATDHRTEVVVPLPEIHFLRLHIEISNLPFLGIGPDATRELVWDCWETSDIRQLTRFTLQIGKGELEYVPSKALIRGTLPNGNGVSHVCESVTGTSFEGLSSVSTDDHVRLIRLCHSLAARCLQLRRAAMSMDIETHPFTHYDQLPETLLESLRRDSVRSTASFQLSSTSSAEPSMPRTQESDSVRCILPGIGMGEFDNEGRLKIQFFSGSTLQIDATGSKVRYRRSLSGVDDEFDLASSSFLPTEVKKHFEHVPTFIRHLKA